MRVFFVLVTITVLVTQRYLWLRLVRDTRLTGKAKRAATWALIALGASVPLSVITWRLTSRAATFPVLSFAWLAFAFYLVGFLALWDAVRAFGWSARALGALRRRLQPTAAEPAPGSVGDAADAGAAPAGPGSAGAGDAMSEPPRVVTAQLDTRRVFIARAAATGALAAASGIGLFGVRSALWEITMPEIAVPLRRLPRALDGYTIALLTDVHIGPLLDGRFLRQLAEQTNAARPDMIAICGDLVDGHVSQIGAQVAELRRLRARHGVFFVTGNHEYYSGASAWVRFLEQLGVRVLMNEHLPIGDAAAGGASFDLAGLPDPHGAWIEGRGPNVELATRGRDPERELVVLAHQPVQIKASGSVGAGLQLSGHTHGGQLYPFGAAARLHQPYLAGLHRHQPTETQIYVSRGTGFWGPPMRVLAPAEIALLRLHSV